MVTNKFIKDMELKDSEKRLIEAVNTIISEDGFSKLGINKIARVAGCDKVLIYRYFGGLEGLVTAWAQKNDFYVQAYDSFIEKIRNIKKENLKDMTKEVLLSQLHFTRENHTLQELLIWELSGNNSFKTIRELREKNGKKLQEVLDEKLGTKKQSASMYITILVTSINYTVLSTLNYPMLNGIDFSEEKSWQKYEETLCRYIDLLFDSIDL